MEDNRAATLIKRNGVLKSQRMRHEPVWRECYDYTYPIRGEEFFSGSMPDAGSALNRAAKLMDSVLTDSSSTLAAALMSGLTPNSTVWPDLQVDNANDEEKRWLGDAAKVVWANIHGSNYDAAGYECSLDAVVAGWFVLFIDDDRDRGGLEFEQWPLGQCSITSSKPGGRIDTIYREYSLTAEQVYNTFGEKCSDSTKQAARTKPDTRVELVREIKPRASAKPGASLARNLPFSSITVEKTGKNIVRESGYHEFPCVVPRWTLIPKSPYATGQALLALPDMRSLNALLINEERATDLAVAGMWIAEDDGVLNPRTIKVGPRKVIVANSVDSMKPLLTGSDFNVSFTKGDEKRRAIRKTMMVTYLEPRDGPVPTATQVHVDVGLLRQLLGPVYGRMQAEWLAPMVERCFGLCYRQGRPELGGRPGPKIIADPPQSLAGRVMQVRYKNPMARAQMLEDVTAIERLTMNGGAMAQAGKPEALDLIDGDEAMRVMAEALGVPTRVIRDERKLKLLREQRAKDQAQQAEQQQAMGTQQAMADAMAQRMAKAT
ncbi:portal protein [Eleftheria terrae]|uniref:portal protein n=1 Tax=Eleftheria terrae TaxID=1597781 RepID=UPI00263A608A|nr:portal protein [Eleftheria terrae]WKB53013.1 portal protein [Eleftheria terrae]